MRRALIEFDILCITFLRRISVPFARLALFLVYFWFGILKILGTSPANPMVADLLGVTMPFMGWDTFIFLFALYEIVIGVSFLIPRLERCAIALLIPHLIMTALPLVFLSGMTWQGFLTPTLEGQYIIKNLVVAALAIGFAAHLHPLTSRNTKVSRK